jgi:hypothetical protein
VVFAPPKDTKNLFSTKTNKPKTRHKKFTSSLSLSISSRMMNSIQFPSSCHNCSVTGTPLIACRGVNDRPECGFRMICPSCFTADHRTCEVCLCRGLNRPSISNEEHQRLVTSLDLFDVCCRCGTQPARHRGCFHTHRGPPCTAKYCSMICLMTDSHRHHRFCTLPANALPDVAVTPQPVLFPLRPCVYCGMGTGSFCDGQRCNGLTPLTGMERMDPSMPHPLCSSCEESHGVCTACIAVGSPPIANMREFILSHQCAPTP